MRSVPISMRLKPAVVTRLRRAGARAQMGLSAYASRALELRLMVPATQSLVPAQPVAELRPPLLWAALRALHFSALGHEWLWARLKKGHLTGASWERAQRAAGALCGPEPGEPAEEGPADGVKIPVTLRLSGGAAKQLDREAEARSRPPSTCGAELLEEIAVGVELPPDVRAAVVELLRVAFFVASGMEQLIGSEAEAAALWSTAEARATERVGWRPEAES